MNSDTNTYFMFLLNISLKEFLLGSLAHSLIKLFTFLLNSLYALSINPLATVPTANVFSHSLDYMLTSWMFSSLHTFFVLCYPISKKPFWDENTFFVSMTRTDFYIYNIRTHDTSHLSLLCPLFPPSQFLPFILFPILTVTYFQLILH